MEKIISHRGNLNGVNKITENTPAQIELALGLGFDVEMDVWVIGDIVYLGHDSPDHVVDRNLLSNNNIWCHCKNLEALILMKKIGAHYFWHEGDSYTVTSRGHIIAHPRVEKVEGCIRNSCNPLFTGRCAGILTDNVAL